MLFSRVANVELGASENRTLITGLHTIRDVSCLSCGLKLGWTYVRAFEQDQKYKENKTILERAVLEKNVGAGSDGVPHDSSDDDDDEDE